MVTPEAIKGLHSIGQRKCLVRRNSVQTYPKPFVLMISVSFITVKKKMKF